MGYPISHMGYFLSHMGNLIFHMGYLISHMRYSLSQMGYLFSTRDTFYPMWKKSPDKKSIPSLTTPIPLAC
jgi:hypothetical protein